MRSPAFDTSGAPPASWRVGAQSLFVEELVLLLLVLDSLLDDESEEDEEEALSEEDDELFSPASFSRARFFVP